MRRNLKYGLSFAALAAAVLLRWLLDPALGNDLPLVTLFGAVAASVWVGGYRPAIVVAITGYLACEYLFIEPRRSFDLAHFGNLVGLAAYLFTCAWIVAFGEALRKSQARTSEQSETLRVTLRSIGDAVITTDTDGRITYLNSVAETMTGWSAADALGQPADKVFRIVNEDTRQVIENPAMKALQQGIVVGLANHTVLIQRNGNECPIDDSAAPIKDEKGRVSGCVVIFRDITSKRRLEKERSAQLMTALLLASIVESSDDAIISKSLDGIIQSWNTAAERLFGYTAEEAVGRHISLVIPPERIAEEDRIIASLKAGQRIDHFETERRRRDGKTIFVSLTISPIKDHSGNIVGASKIVRDNTERKRMSDNLQKLADDLSEADRRKNEFIAMLSHELRNPLAPISNAVQILRLAGSDRPEVITASQMLERQVAQMSRLVDDLLDMSRISRGRIELRKQRTPLAPIIHQAVEASRALYCSMNQQLTVMLPDKPVYLDADPARLAQVVGNLLNNACKFTDRSGHIDLVVEPDHDQVRIRVRDNGIGIAPEQLSNIFHMFTQVDTSLERSRDGLGIGLTLVKILVEMHGGSVQAQSRGLGQGSEFTIQLPILAEMPEPMSSAVFEPATGVARRVLIVDDSQDGAESLALLVEMKGHETFMAHDGMEALEAAERIRPDVVLLDIGLPSMNGFEVCRHIREKSWGKGLILVALTGWGQEEDRRKSKEAGFDAHLVKPVDYDALMKVLSFGEPS